MAPVATACIIIGGLMLAGFFVFAFVILLTATLELTWPRK